MRVCLFRHSRVKRARLSHDARRHPNRAAGTIAVPDPQVDTAFMHGGTLSEIGLAGPARTMVDR